MDDEDEQSEDAQTEHTRNPVHYLLDSTLPAHFGAALRLLRRHGSVPVRSAAEVCTGLATHGYHLETSTYRAVEAGLCLPKEPARFLEALAECLELSDPDVVGLTWRLAYEILCIQLGEEVANELFLDATPPTPPELSREPVWTGDAHSTACASTPSSDLHVSASLRKPVQRWDRTCTSRKYAELRHGRRARLANPAELKPRRT